MRSTVRKGSPVKARSTHALYDPGARRFAKGDHQVKATAAILLVLAMACVDVRASNWEIYLAADAPDDEGGCRAIWRANGFTIQLAEHRASDEDRAALGLATHRPVLRWTFDTSSEEPPPPDEQDEDFTLEARLFPDNGEGFIELGDHNSVVYGQLWDGEWFPYARRWMLQWTDFPVERLRTWAVANDPQATANVTLPEVRLILKWTDTIGRSDGYEVERYLDVPLWRTANVVNKLERCSCKMRRNMDSARCWSE